MKLVSTVLVLCQFVMAGLALASDNELLPVTGSLDDDVKFVRALKNHQSSLSKKAARTELTSTSDTLAVTAAWRRVSSSFDVLLGPTDSAARINDAELQRFLGFVEGRLRLAIPDFWERAFETGKYRQKYRLIFDVPMVANAGESMSPVTIRQRNGALEFESPSRTYRIPNSEEDGDLPGFEPRAYLFERESNAFIVLMDSIDTGCDLFHFNGKDGRLVWQRRVWGHPYLNLSGRYLPHLVELVVDDETVTAFGSSPTNLYIEQFSIDKGTPKLRFATHYLRLSDPSIVNSANVKDESEEVNKSGDR